VDRINLALIVDMLMNLWVIQNAGNFDYLSDCWLLNQKSVP
jgi:hypothetical protein